MHFPTLHLFFKHTKCLFWMVNTYWRRCYKYESCTVWRIKLNPYVCMRLFDCDSSLLLPVKVASCYYMLEAISKAIVIDVPQYDLMHVSTRMAAYEGLQWYRAAPNNTS